MPIPRSFLGAWIGFFAEDAEWWEYHERNPPRSPKVIRGRANIWKLLEAVANAPVGLKIDDEIVTSERAAFRAWVILPDGNRLVEHVMLDTQERKMSNSKLGTYVGIDLAARLENDGRTIFGRSLTARSRRICAILTAIWKKPSARF